MGRRNRLIPFTDQQKEYILINYQIKTVKEMAVELGMGYIDRRIYRFLDEKHLDTLDGTRKAKRKNIVPEGMFDPNEKDWMIG